MVLSLQSGAFSAGVPAIGTDFLVATVELLTDSAVRVWYTHAPVLGSGKANDVASYSLSGPETVAVSLATSTSTSPLAIDLYFDKPLSIGQWELGFTAANIVSSITATQLPADSEYIFTVTKISQVDGLPTDNNLTRKFMNPAFLGKANWEAVIAGLETGRDIVTTSINRMFNQYFLSSASGKYLDTRASNYGIIKPTVLGLADDIFKKLAITIINDKLTTNANLDLLEVIYGPSATMANITSQLSEPFSLFDQANLEVVVDGKITVNAVFSWSRFKNPLRATADEVCACLNTAFKKYNTAAFATTHTDPETSEVMVRLFSGSKGLGSTIKVSKGSASPIFRFYSNILGAEGVAIPGTVAISSLPLDKAMVQFNSDSTYVLSAIHAGDCITILGSEFALGNRGSFIVESASSASSSVIITNKTAVTEVVLPTSTNSLTICCPFIKTIYDNTNFAYISSGNRSSKVSLPVSTQIINRDSGTAAYPGVATEKNIAATVFPDGHCVISNTGTINGFGLISGFFPKILADNELLTTPGVPATIIDPAGTTDLSYFSRASVDEYFEGAMPLCIADLRGNIHLFGGYVLDTSSTVNQLSNYSVVDVDEDATGAKSHDYTWATASIVSVHGTGSSIALIDYPRFWNNILVVGGYPNGPDFSPGVGYVQQKTYLYSPDADTYNEITGTQPAIATADAGLIWLGSPYNKAVLVGGMDDTGAASTYASYWDPSYSTDSQAGIWYNGNGTELLYARINPQLADLGGGRILVVGGRIPATSNTFTLDAFGTPLNSCEILEPTDDWSVAPVLAGPMAYARFAFGMVTLPDGRVLVVGGIGAPASEAVDTNTDQQDNELRSCEIYDPTLGYWSSLPNTLEPHSYCSCHYEPTTRRVYVAGGASSTKIEYLDLDTMTWKLSVARLSEVSFRTTSAMVVKEGLPIIVRPGGSVVVNGTETDANKTHIIQIVGESIRSGGVNTIQKVIPAGPDTSSTLDQIPGFSVSDPASQAVFTPLTATAKSTPGPYIYDKGQPFGLTGQILTLASPIPQGRGCPAITITGDTTSLSKEGYLVVDYGFKDQVGPVKYFLRNATTLILDPAFTFPTWFSAANDIKLSIVSSRAAYTPTEITQPGAFYVTASNAGLAAAQQYIKDISATGIDLLIKVRYPGDRGLGNEGNPLDNYYKLSDIIEVFGPDALDSFLDEVRDES